ncbi:MAG: tyrosine--tRNA ligase [Clostridiales bacterium]|jgi:tyrosyl-tRNA synthetase|nr:tyrosine--tRNA ligase [Clostridiales bacterium]
MNRNAFDVLTERGFIEQVTHEGLKDLMGKEKLTFYIGYDPTADSLTVGGFLTAMALGHMQRAGHRPVVLMGGGTGMIGDPTDKNEARRMMTVEEINRNVEGIRAQMSRFIDFSDGKAIMANNADWLLELNYVKFLREMGIHFSVNRMLAADCFKMRFERDQGLTFFELNYMVMQAYDFLELNRRYGCVLQVGGRDQWSNIIAGMELIRKVEGKDAYGMTFSLLTRADGEKMGKSMKGAIWLDANKTSPYEFFQYFRNTDDRDVEKYFKLLTFLELDDIKTHMADNINEAKSVLAYEITKLVHGQEAADNAKSAAAALFGGAGDDAAAPSTEFQAEDFNGGMEIAALLERTSLAPSRSEARRLVQQGGVVVAGEKVGDTAFRVTEELFKDGELMIKKGKKTFHKVKIK